MGPRRIQGCVFVLASALAAVVSTADPGDKGVPVKQTRNLTEFDSILGWRRIPGFHGTHIQGEYQVEMRYNARGFRGTLYPYERRPGTHRILILGDSYADGYSVAFKDLFTETMQQHLKKTIKQPLEVVNSAVGGYGTDQQLLYFLVDGQHYKPDLTILLFYQNDLTYNIKANYTPLGRGEKPLFGLRGGTLYLKSLPKPARDREAVPRENFYPAERVKETLEMFARPEAPGGNAPKGPGGKAGVYGSGTQEAQWRMTEALMKKIKASCDASGSHLLLFYVPIKREIYGSGGKVHRKSSGIFSHLQVLAARLEIDLVDTLPLYQEKAGQIAGQQQRLYWVRDSHWTPEGHHLAGEILARYLSDRCKRYGLCE